ncbi:MAG: GtrA family protein [Bacillota bacterium]|nr:GtrA family protein [Bacillota bacterium]
MLGNLARLEFIDKILQIFIKDDKKRAAFMEIIRFAIVGVICFIFDAGTLWLVMHFVFGNQINNFSTGVSTTAGFLIGVTMNYILSIFFVFIREDQKDKGKNAKAMIIFLVGSAIGLLLNNVIMNIGAVQLNFYYMIVKVFATLVVMVWNYLSRKILIFK